MASSRQGRSLCPDEIEQLLFDNDSIASSDDSIPGEEPQSEDEQTDTNDEPGQWTTGSFRPKLHQFTGKVASDFDCIHEHKNTR